MEDFQDVKVGVFCSCGQRIFEGDVIHKGTQLRRVDTTYVYLRFRCSRCRRLGESFIRLEAWDEKILRHEIREMDPEEMLTKANMGPISLDEMLHFHYSLETLPRLDASTDAQRDTDRDENV